MSGNQPFPRTGTTAPIFVARDGDSQPITIGQDYFLIQIYAAQVAFRGAIWDNVKRLVVTSQVNLNHRKLDNRALRAIQRTRDVQKNQMQPLGLTPNLISLVPAVMPNVTLSIDFILDRENRLAQLGGLINSDSFVSAISLATGTAAVAKTIAQLADKVIQTFIPAEESKPLLSFSGDFNLATQQLRSGYYVIIGSKDEQNPLPAPTARVEVRDGGLIVEGQPATQWSYVILDVQRVGTRPRELNDGALWDLRLREAEDEAQRLTMNPLATDEERKQAWNKCLKLIQEAQILLRADDNFLPKDATHIVEATLWNCRKLIEEAENKRAFRSAVPSWQPTLANDLIALGLSPETDLAKMVEQYANQVVQARRILKSRAML
ncbi:MAG: hypothetical protein N2559_12630 [Anaerolineae bacterium]|nr:hypothetical protein [Anaerolineae bacterium]